MSGQPAPAAKAKARKTPRRAERPQKTAAVERTLSIVKPDAVAKNLIGEIYSRFEQTGLRVIAAKMLHLSPRQAENLYEVHRDRPFFRELVQFMTSGPVMVQVLEGEDAIRKQRKIMGATIPKYAAAGTIRHDFANSVKSGGVHENAVHGSDSSQSARAEIAIFFSPDEICRRTR
ncbi:MAG: nucleoside-diphosphate kinase [Gammaproteobacteria bacterium]|nr:nucleoside-diphosphate kinase [Gammaproteobacteria bacterium]